MESWAKSKQVWVFKRSNPFKNLESLKNHHVKRLGKKTIQQEIRHEKGTPQENEFKEQNGREPFCPSQELQKEWNLKENIDLCLLRQATQQFLADISTFTKMNAYICGRLHISSHTEGNILSYNFNFQIFSLSSDICLVS